MIDQIPWHEMDVDGELVLRTRDDFSRRLETRLRRTLYLWRHMRADMVAEPVLDIPKAIRGADFGVRVIEETAVGDPANDVVGHRYLDQLKTEEDILRIRTPDVGLDERATAQAEQRAHDILDGILGVRMQGLFPAFAPGDQIVQWHGAENLILDLADRPDFMHRMVSRLTDAHLAMLDQLEAKGLLGFGQSTIHCTGRREGCEPSDQAGAL